jgi:hypothetical protein
MGDSSLVVFLDMSVEGEKYFETRLCATTSKTNKKFQDIRIFGKRNFADCCIMPATTK